MRKIVVATPFYNYTGHSAHEMSLFQIAYVVGRCLPQIELDFWRFDGDPYVWSVRNRMANKLMESDFDEMVSIDSDLSWDMEGFLRLLSRDVPVVGGAYLRKNQWIDYTCLIDTDDKGIAKVTPDGLIEAHKGFVTTGFMKVKKEVFEQLVKDNPDDWYHDADHDKKVMIKTWDFFSHKFLNHYFYGEDTSFCLRCKKSGIPLFLEPDINLTHWGIRKEKANYHEFLKRQPGGIDDPARTDADKKGDL